MFNLSDVYQYFTLEQWVIIVQSIRSNENLTQEEKNDILVKCPSAAL